MGNPLYPSGLSVCLTPNEWKKLPAEQRETKTYELLCVLVAAHEHNKFMDRALTFCGSFVASLVALIPTIWIILDFVKARY